MPNVTDIDVLQFVEIAEGEDKEGPVLICDDILPGKHAKCL